MKKNSEYNYSIKQEESFINEVFPFAYELYKKEENFEYRKFIVKNYIIIYKINLKEKEIKVLHIYNQKLNYNKKPITI